METEASPIFWPIAGGSFGEMFHQNPKILEHLVKNCGILGFKSESFVLFPKYSEKIPFPNILKDKLHQVLSELEYRQRIIAGFENLQVPQTSTEVTIHWLEKIRTLHFLILEAEVAHPSSINVVSNCVRGLSGGKLYIWEMREVFLTLLNTMNNILGRIVELDINPIQQSLPEYKLYVN